METISFLLLAIILAIIYSDVTLKDQNSIQNIQGVLINIACEMMFSFSYAVIYELPSQFPLIRRETGEHLYPFSVYYVATFVKNVSISFRYIQQITCSAPIKT